MRIGMIKLPVVGDCGSHDTRWFNKAQITEVEGQNWMQMCKIKVRNEEWVFIALPVARVMEFLQ